MTEKPKTAEEIWNELTMYDSFVHPDTLKTNMGKRILEAMEAFHQSKMVEEVTDNEIENAASESQAFTAEGYFADGAKWMRDRIFNK